MQFRTKLLAATALVFAVAACGSPAEEADDQAATNEVLTTEEVLNAEPEELDAAVDAAEEGGTESADEAAEPGAAAPKGAAPSPDAAARPSPAATPASAQAPAMWAVCSACHSAEPGEHGIGPSLAGVFGTRAASKPGFDYSQAMKDSGLTWNEATLQRYLEDPRGVVPGTTMAYAGLKNAQQRQAMIDYLKTL